MRHMKERRDDFSQMFVSDPAVDAMCKYRSMV